MLHLKNVHIKNEGGVMTMKRILLVCGTAVKVLKKKKKDSINLIEEEGE